MTIETELPGHFVNRSGFIRLDGSTKQLNPIYKFGIITCDPYRRILSVVRNLSPTGALLEVDNDVEIPDQFTLAIEAEPFARLCRIVWKRSNQIAVNFDTSPREVNPDRTERRQAPRRALNTAGWIRLDGGFAMRECKIVDLSIAGVRICFPFAGKMPPSFTVFFSKHGQGHRVRTIWRRGNEIGGKFI
jgi:PilZ domain